MTSDLRLVIPAAQDVDFRSIAHRTGAQDRLTVSGLPMAGPSSRRALVAGIAPESRPLR